MTKTEKIIKGLECCTSGLGNCDKCPYDYVTDCQMHEGCMSDAKELLTSCKNLRFFVKENPDGLPIEFKIAFKLTETLIEQNIIKITTRKYGDGTITNVKFNIKQLCNAGQIDYKTIQKMMPDSNGFADE